MHLRDNAILLLAILFTLFVVWLSGFPYGSDLSYQDWR